MRSSSRGTAQHHRRAPRDALFRRLLAHARSDVRLAVFPEQRSDIEVAAIILLAAPAARLPCVEADERPRAHLEDALMPWPAEATRLPVVEAVQDRVIR